MTTGLPPSRTLPGDAAWNFAALAVTAGTGAGLTFALAGWRGAPVLGVFAQLYAVHVIGAQVAVFGAHDSVQKHVAELHDRPGRSDNAVVLSALGLVGVTSTLLAAVLALAAPSLGVLVRSDDVGRGLWLVAPGVVFLALNKVLFAALNGRGQLRLYGVMQMLRAAFVIVALALFLGLSLPAYAVGGLFTLAELLLLPCLLAAVQPTRGRAAARVDAAYWWRRHFTFGGRGLVNGILLETHLRVDVVTLSYFMPDRLVGIYAFAALFAEGLYQVPVVIRTVAYPTLVRLASRLDRVALAQTTRRLALASGAITAAVAVTVAIAYPVVGALFDPAYADVGGRPLAILLVGMTLYAVVVPFDQLLLQSGLPGRQSLLMALYVGANVFMNIRLIPQFGLEGAAVATALALVLAAVLMLAASWIWLGYRGSVLLYRASTT